MTANINITDEPTPYPAPTYYGCDAFGHPTKFYKPEWVEHARQLHDGRKGDNPDKPEFQLQQGPVAFRIVPFDGDVASIPLKLGKPLPKAGVFAHAQAEVVARAIARAVTGRGRSAEFDGHGECFVETGGGKAGFGSGDFYAEPVPRVTLRQPSRVWHAGKVLFEKVWLWRWF